MSLLILERLLFLVYDRLVNLAKRKNCVTSINDKCLRLCVYEFLEIDIIMKDKKS